LSSVGDVGVGRATPTTPIIIPSLFLVLRLVVLIIAEFGLGGPQDEGVRRSGGGKGLG